MAHALELLALMRRPCPAHPTADAKCVLGDGTPACVDCARAEAVADAAFPADDPRHGTNAGSVAHWRVGQKPCGPCRDAANRDSKRARIDRERGNPRTVPLGDRAHQVILNVPADQLARATGLTVSKLCRLRAGGPDQTVHRNTAHRIRRAGARDYWTPVGVRRRVLALAAIGWSSRALANESGVGYEAIKRLVRVDQRAFVRRDVATAVIATYDRLCMTPGSGCGATRAINKARKNNDAPPLAWTNIDDPDEVPVGTLCAPTTMAEKYAEDRAQRLAHLEESLERGHTLARVCADLDIAPGSLHKWCARTDHLDLWEALSAPTRTSSNAHAQRGAA